MQGIQHFKISNNEFYFQNSSTHMSNLAKLLELTRIKQKSLATKLGVSRSAVCQQVKKGIKDVHTATEYSKALNCPARWLLDFE